MKTLKQNKKLKDFQVGGKITNTGYLNDSPDRFNDFNIIPSNRITMKNVAFPVMGIDDTGHSKMMFPGENHTFPGKRVLEIPIPKAQNGFSDPQKTMFGFVPRPVGFRPELDVNGNPVNPAQTFSDPNAPKMYEMDPNQIFKVPPPTPKKSKMLGDINRMISDYPGQIMDLGLGMLNGSLSRDPNDRDRNTILGGTDNLYAPVDASRGDWTTNEGYFQPDRKTPVQFARMGGPSELPTPVTAGNGDGLLPSMMTINVPKYVPDSTPYLPNIKSMIKPAPQSQNNENPNIDLTANFKDYANKAEKYIQSVKPDSAVTGEMLAKSAQQTYDTTGKLVPLQLALAQLTQEGYLAKGNGNKPQRTQNPFDVGNTDDGSTVTFNSVQQGINKYYNLIAKSYLSNKTVSDLLNNFTNKNNDRYATDPNYEIRLKQHIKDINKTIMRDGGTFQVGGEYEMDDDQLKQFLANGGQVQYI